MPSATDRRMPTRILIATDFSDASEEAIRQAHAIAARDHAILGLCQVVPEPLPEWVQSHVPSIEEIERRALEATERRAAELRNGGVRVVEAFVSVGRDYAEIVRRAETFAADLIVVGSHGRTGLARTLLGSVAERVVQHAPCAVLVARKGPDAGPVVTSTDFSEASKPGLRAAATEAARTGSPLIGLHVIELAWQGKTPFAADAWGLSTVESDAEAVRRATADLDKTLEEAARGHIVEVRGEVLAGAPATRIVERAEQLQARLVVVSTHGRTGLARTLLGSVAEKVVRHAHTSVLVVRGTVPSQD
jgi:nucleotide-binding universal stress UspA family protein